MTEHDPYPRRRRGFRRARLLTVGLGAAALAGSGALTAALATPSAGVPAATSTIQGTTPGTTSGTGVSAPQQLPTSGGSVHASSGGS